MTASAPNPKGRKYPLGRIQTLRSEGNVVQRLVYVKDAMQLFRRSPVVGLGMGAFENGIYNVQSYHYETKYVHNHYVQTMVDTGVIGLALWPCVWVCTVTFTGPSASTRSVYSPAPR